MSITKDDSSHDADHGKNDQESASLDARMEAFQRRKMILGAAINHSRIPPVAVLRAVWRELCSLVARIAILRRNNWFPRGVLLDHFAQEGYVQYPVQCKYRRARIRGIQRVLSIHPRATLVDFHILVSAIDPQLFPEDQDTAESTNRRSHNQRGNCHSDTTERSEHNNA